MLLQIGVKAPDGKDPLALLAAVHRRHLSRLRSLQFASAHLLDEDTLRRAEALEHLAEALTFFDRAADDPFREEAELLFPVLVQSAPDDTELRAACQALGGDRDTAGRLHAEVARHGIRLVRSDATTELVTLLGAHVDSLETLYRAHIERLENQVFPRARTLLADSDRQELSERMFAETRSTVIPNERRKESIGAAAS